jgi:hypothetical protein
MCNKNLIEDEAEKIVLGMLPAISYVINKHNTLPIHNHEKNEYIGTLFQYIAQELYQLEEELFLPDNKKSNVISMDCFRKRNK